MQIQRQAGEVKVLVGAFIYGTCLCAASCRNRRYHLVYAEEKRISFVNAFSGKSTVSAWRTQEPDFPISLQCIGTRLISSRRKMWRITCWSWLNISDAVLNWRKTKCFLYKTSWIFVMFVYYIFERGRVGEDFTATVTVEEALDASRDDSSDDYTNPGWECNQAWTAGKDGEKELTICLCERMVTVLRFVITAAGIFPHVTSATSGNGYWLKVLYQTIQLLNTKKQEWQNTFWNNQ